MSTDRVAHHVTIKVVCGFIGCPWSMEIGTAPIEAHNAYLNHLDVHDPDYVADHSDQEDGPAEAAGGVIHRTPDGNHLLVSGCCPYNPSPSGLYAGDTAEQLAAEQARVDRFMAGREDR